MTLREILLVEDNPDDEALTLRALTKARIGNPVVVARDGAEALDCLVGDQYRPFALVLLDLRLPKIPGLTVLERLRADPRTRHTPIVILSSSREESDLARGYAAGVNSYIRKPVDFHEFLAAVALIGQYWLQLNELPTPAAAMPPGDAAAAPAPDGR